jgi:hypothetical protein
MQRYRIVPTTTVDHKPWEDARTTTISRALEPCPDGDFVKWSDVQAHIATLEAQIPGKVENKQLAALELAVIAISQGKCPGCGRETRDYKPAFGSFAPEVWATLREMGVDPLTNHRFDCSATKPNPIILG